MFSWIEPSQGGAFALRYAVRHGGAWSPATTIAAHRHFFHHPAEMPEVLALPGGHWFAHWVEAPEGGDSDAEYVYVSSSTDGTHWTMPLQAHHDHSAVQHGLASMIANPDGGASIFWLEALKGEDAPSRFEAHHRGRHGQRGAGRANPRRCLRLLPHGGDEDIQGTAGGFSRAQQGRHSRHRCHAAGERQLVHAQDRERG